MIYFLVPGFAPTFCGQRNIVTWVIIYIPRLSFKDIKGFWQMLEAEIKSPDFISSECTYSASTAISGASKNFYTYSFVQSGEVRRGMG